MTMTALSIRYDDDPLFEMTTDYPFDMTRLSLRNEGSLTLLLTIKTTVIFLSFRTYNLNTPTRHFQRDNSFGKECSFFAKERPFLKRKPYAKTLKTLSSRNDKRFSKKSIIESI